MYQVVIAMVPEGPGISPDALDGLRGQDLFKLVSPEGLRMSFEGPGGGISPTFVRSHRTRWVLRDDVTRSSLGELVIGIMNRPGASDPLALMSDSWISFAHESNPGGQEIIVSKGAIEGRVSMRQSGTVLLGSINGGPEQVLVRDVPLSTTGSFLFEIVMPLNRARGVTNRLANELVPEYAGSWTVTANPPLGQNLPAGTEPEGRTPFQFDLVGLYLTVDSAVFRPDEVIPKTETEPEKRWSRGGTYQVTSRILGNQDFAGVFGAKTLGWKAEVISPSNEVIRTLYGLTPQGSFPVEWDGKTSSGQSAPGGIRYGIRMSALVRDNVDPTDPAENSGGHLKTSSLAEGPADADLPPFGELQVTPNPYIVYEYRFDDEGYAIWPDDTGDGIPDRFPDDDGDGVPDYEAGTVVPIEIYAPLNRKGYDTTWSVEVFAEDGTKLREEPWTGVGDIEISWADPPQDLEPQEFTYKVTASTCRSPVALEVRAQQFAGCLASTPGATQQYKAQPAKLEIVRTPNGGGSDRLALGLLPGSQDVPLRKEAFKLFATVHRENGPIYFKASGFQFSANSAPPNIKLKLKSVTSGRAAPDEIFLAETSSGSGVYISPAVELDTVALSDTDPMMDDGSPIQTPYAVGSIFDAFSAVERFQTFVIDQIYPIERVLLAKFDEGVPFLTKRDGTQPTELFPEPSSLAPELAAATVPNIQTLGSETFLGELVEQANVPALKVYLKNHYPGRVALLNFHGDHLTGAISVADSEFRSALPPADPTVSPPPPLFPGGEDFLPTDLLGQYTAKVDTLMLVSCDVLDINDYNNYLEWQIFTGQTDANGIAISNWTLEGARPSPGRKWFDKFILPNLSSRPLTGGTKPQQVLLGYNGPAPVQAMPHVMEEYGRQLATFGSASNARQMAWVAANLIVGQNPAFGDPSKGPAELTLQACAIDRDYYYYIPFEYDYARRTQLYCPLKTTTQAGVHWVRRVNPTNPGRDWPDTPQEWDRNFTAPANGGLGMAEKARSLR